MVYWPAVKIGVRGMGLFNWLGKAPTRLANYGKKVVGAEGIKNNADFIVDMAKGLSNKPSRFETFQSAYERLGLTEDKLKSNYDYHIMRFNLFFAFIGLALVALVYFSVQGNYLAIVSSLAFVALCVSQLFNASFRMYQIRRRELVSVLEWFNNRDQWWIKPFTPDRELQQRQREEAKRVMRINKPTHLSQPKK